MKKYQNQDRLSDIIHKRLISVPKNIRDSMPPIFTKDKPLWFSRMSDLYFMVVFFNASDFKRIDSLIQKGFDPFPGLITTDKDVQAAFRLEKSRNTFISNCTVKNMYGLSLGKNTSIILCNHQQSINTIEVGMLDYVVELAYIISFGDEINQANYLDFVDGLIAYSINEWRLAYGKVASDI